MTLFKLLKLGRIHFSLGGLLLFLFGVSLAISEGIDLPLNRVIVAYLAAFLGQLSVSYSNDYFDVEVDKKGKRTFFSGGSGVLLENPELRELSKKIALFLIASSLTFAIIGIIFFGLPSYFLLIALAGNFFGWFYSAPPLKLAYRGLGEFSTILTAGFLLPLAGYVSVSDIITSGYIALSIPLLLYGLFFILSVQLPDAESDRLGGKKTFVARNGRDVGFALIDLSSFFASAYLFNMSLSSTPVVLSFAILSLVPTSAGVFSFLFRKEEDGQVAKLSFMNVSSLFLFIALAILVFFLAKPALPRIFS